MRKEIAKWLSSRVNVNKCRLYGEGRYVKVYIESGIKIVLNEIISLKVKVGAEDVLISSVHTEDIGYCIMIEFFRKS